jgi:hypothetical protein
MRWSEYPVTIPKLECYPNYVAEEGNCLCPMAEFYYLAYLATIFNHQLPVKSIELKVCGPWNVEYSLQAVQKKPIEVTTATGSKTLLFGDPTIVVVDDVFPGGCFKDMILVPRQPGTTYWAGRQLRRHGFLYSWNLLQKRGPLHDEIERAELTLLGKQAKQYELLYAALLQHCFSGRNKNTVGSIQQLELFPSGKQVNHVLS